MSADRLQPKTKHLEGMDAEFFLRKVSQVDAQQDLQHLLGPAALPMTNTEARKSVTASVHENGYKKKQTTQAESPNKQ